MDRNWWTRFGLVVLVAVGSLWFLTPTYYSMFVLDRADRFAGKVHIRQRLHKKDLLSAHDDSGNVGFHVLLPAGDLPAIRQNVDHIEAHVVPRMLIFLSRISQACNDLHYVSKRELTEASWKIRRMASPRSGAMESWVSLLPRPSTFSFSTGRELVTMSSLILDLLILSVAGSVSTGWHTAA